MITKKYTDQEILEALRKHPNLSKYGWGIFGLKPCFTTIVKRFGSWNKAKELAGLEVREPRGTGLGCSKNDVLKVLKANPSMARREWVKRKLRPSLSTIIKRWGSWNKAKEMAGLKTFPWGPPKIPDFVKEEKVRAALKMGLDNQEARRILKRYPEAYLKITDGWAEKTFRRWIDLPRPPSQGFKKRGKLRWERGT